MNLFARLAAAACSASALLFTAAAAGPELGPESFGILKDKPTYIQEWHIWWGFRTRIPGGLSPIWIRP